MEYNICVVDLSTGTAYLGDTRAEVLNKICNWGLDKTGSLYMKLPHYEKQVFHSYSDSYTSEEAILDGSKFLFEKLKSYRYQIFYKSK